MALDQELLVAKKVEQLLYRIYPKLVAYPKSEKFGLGARTKEAFFDIMKFIAMGNAVKSKRKVYLQEADGHLQTLKALIKLAHHRKYISHGFFNDLDLALSEINRMLSGYIKSVA